MNQATTTAGLTQKQYLLIAGFLVVVGIGAFVYYNGFIGNANEAPPLPATTTSP